MLQSPRHQTGGDGDVAEQGQRLLVSALLALERRDYTRALQACEAAEQMFMSLPTALHRRDDELQ